MNKKVIVGVFSAVLILGGAVSVGASKNNTSIDDTKHQEDRIVSAVVENQPFSPAAKKQQEVEIETEHGQTLIKVKSHGGNTNSTMEDHQSHKHSGKDDKNMNDGSHQNRHSGDYDAGKEDN